MKLLAYILNGKPINEYKNTLLSIQNGRPYYIFIEDNEPIPEDYVDITSIENWASYGLNVGDFLFVKNRIKEIYLAKGWDNLTDAEKNICIDYYIYDGIKAAYFLASTGQVMLEDVKDYLIEKWKAYYDNFLETCQIRWDKAQTFVTKYLSYRDAEDLYISCKSLITDYLTIGRFGTNYGDSISGILDFVESTGDYVNNGLNEKNYSYSNITKENFIFGIKRLLIEGY